MFFQSLIKKKQSLFTPNSPRYDYIAERKEININNFTHKNDKQNGQHNRLSINRSKSEKEFNNSNGLMSHLKGPIIPKQKSSIRQVGVGENMELQKQLKQLREYNICKNKINSCEKVLRTDSILSKGGQNQRLLDLNQYQLRSSNRQVNTNSHHKIISNKEFKDSAYKSFQTCQPFHCSQSSSGKNTDNYDIHDQNQSFKFKSPMTSTFPAQFSIDKPFNEYFQQETTKMSQKQYQNGDLRLMIKNLQRQMALISRQRDKDKGKLLQSSILIDKLKFQNECIKKSFYKSKQNIDGKGKSGNEATQLRRMLKQQIQLKQFLQRQRRNILAQLNQTLQTYQRQKNRWQKQKLESQHKLDVLLKQVRQKKNQNIELAQKSNRICNENKKLRQSKSQLEKQLQQKSEQVKWVNSKVTDLKQALQYFKQHGNFKIKKLQEELTNVDIKRKDNANSQIRLLQTKLLQKQNLILQLRQEIQRHSTTINNLKHEAKNLSGSLQIKENALINGYNNQIQGLKAQVETIKKQNQQLKNKLQRQIIIQQQFISQKNKVIQALAKNVSDVNSQIQTMKRQKLISENLLEEVKNHSLKIQKQNSKIKLQQQRLKNQVDNKLQRVIYLERKLQDIQVELNKNIEKLQQKHNQIANMNKQIQRYKQIYSSKYQQSRTKQEKIKYFQNKCQQLNLQLEISNKNLNQIKNLLQIKQKQSQNADKQITKLKRQGLEALYKLQCSNKQVEAQQKLIQSKNNQIQVLQQEINKANSKLKESQQKIVNLVLSSRKIQENNRNQRRSQSVSPTHYSTSSYTQLQMKLCSILGICLTSNIQKLLSPIDQMMKNKRIMQNNSRNYEQLLKIFNTTQHYRLVLQMKQYRNCYTRLKQINEQQENQLVALRQQKLFLEERTQISSIVCRKLQVIIEDSNDKLMRAMVKSFNQKYNYNGLKKY